VGKRKRESERKEKRTTGTLLVLTLEKINYTFLAYLPYFEKYKRLIRSPRYLCPPAHLKARIVKPEEPAVVRQWLAKHISAVMNTHATIENLLNVFSMRSVTHGYPVCSERKVGDWFFPELHVIASVTIPSNEWALPYKSAYFNFSERREITDPTCIYTFFFLLFKLRVS
jgi:hypothetical protein